MGFPKPNEVSRRLDLLHPEFRRPATLLDAYLTRAHEAGETKTLFKFYEGFRLPDRQLHLLAQGTTKAGPWQSAHNYGLAADWVPYVDAHSWNWGDGHDWPFLKKAAEKHGLLRPIAWDLAHVESPLWRKITKLVL